MDKAKEYINSKTNSILKTNILRNNRDVVATIVYNELTDLLEFSNTSSVTTPIDSEILKRYLHQVKPQLYSGIPMKLKPYCIKCGCGNGHFRGLYDPSRDDVAPSTYTVTVVLNSDSVGKCTVKVVGDVVSIVPSDEAVDAYKVADGWRKWASMIKPLSEYVE